MIKNLATISILFFAACNQSSTTTPTTQIEIHQLESQMAGTYQAILVPINSHITGKSNGSLTIVRQKNDLIADVRLSAGPRTNLQIQNIHLGNQCPTLKDDLNNDGVVDTEEAQRLVHEIIVPLDDDLNSQRMGSGIFPQTDEFGYYLWSKVASYKKMMDDLLDEDINPLDNIAKIKSAETFTVEGKVILIAGVSTTTTLPESVMGSERLTAHQALPVACGIIKRVTKVPGVIDTDYTGISVPEGETVGGSGGMDDGAIFVRDTNYGDDNEDIL